MTTDGVFKNCMRQVRRQVMPVMWFSLAVNLLMLISSIYMMQVFDRVLASGSLHTLLWLTIAALLGIAAYAVIEQARRRVLARTGLWVEQRLSQPVIRRGVDARLAGVRSEASASDVGDLKIFISGEALLAFLDAPWMPIFIIVIWLMHPALGAVAVAGAVILFGLAVLNDVLTRSASARSAGDARQLQFSAQQMVEHGETLKPLGMVDPMLRRWRDRQGAVHAGAQGTQDVTETISNLTRALRLGLQIVILGVGALLVLRGQLTSGGMIGASIILGRALSPVERALTAWRSWVSARTAHANLRALFDALPDHAGPMDLPAPVGRLAMEAVRYAPPGAVEPVLRGIDACIEQGTTCGILGPSGSGKSTLCRLIVGAWVPSSGHVRLDGADITAWNPTQLGRSIGYLPQQIDLFPGTVAENIARMGVVDAEKVARAAMLADVHEMILRLPEGYDTDVGRLGNRLSGGQRQRIGLARALYGDPVLVVLDEPNSNLDGDGEQALNRALIELKRLGRTVVIVAHQPGALRTADTLLVLRDGAVGAFGPRDEVLKHLMVPKPRDEATAPAPRSAPVGPAAASSATSFAAAPFAAAPLAARAPAE